MVACHAVSELTLLLAKSRDPEELKHIWVEFRKNAGDKVRKSFTEYVELLNEAAKLNSEFWLRGGSLQVWFIKEIDQVYLRVL